MTKVDNVKVQHESRIYLSIYYTYYVIYRNLNVLYKTFCLKSSIIFSFSQGLIERKICIIMYCFDYHCIVVVFAHAQSAHSKMST